MAERAPVRRIQEPEGTDTRGRRGYWVAVLLVFAILANLQAILGLVEGFRQFHRAHPFYLAEGIKTALQVVGCVAAVMVAGRTSPRGALRELKVSGGFVVGLGIGAVSTLPMWIGFALTAREGSAGPWPAVVYLALVAPFAEELLFRAYAFGQLSARCRWRLAPASLVPAVLFGLGHVDKGSGPGQVAALFLLTGLGALLFSYLYWRWNSLWPAYWLHALMNLAWEVFAVGDTALGGWFALVLQGTTALVALALTLGLAPPRPTSPPAASAREAAPRGSASLRRPCRGRG